jgi:hypothetical protein
VRAEIGMVAADILRPHLAAHPLARFEHRHGPSPVAQPPRGAQPTEPCADDRDVDLRLRAFHPCKLTEPASPSRSPGPA